MVETWIVGGAETSVARFEADQQIFVELVPTEAVLAFGNMGEPASFHISKNIFSL